jgi:hypothetical protein
MSAQSSILSPSAEGAVKEGRKFSHEIMRRTTIHIVMEVAGDLVEDVDDGNRRLRRLKVGP